MNRRAPFILRISRSQGPQTTDHPLPFERKEKKDSSPIEVIRMRIAILIVLILSINTLPIAGSTHAGEQRT